MKENDENKFKFWDDFTIIYPSEVMVEDIEVPELEDEEI